MSIAREVEKGTMEILLSRPVSRLRIFLERYLAGVFMMIVFLIFSIFSVIPFAEIYDVSYVLENYFSVALICLLFSLAIFSLAMMFSVMFSERGKVYMVTGFILVLMYFLKIIASLKETWEDLKYLSFFHYFDAEKALVQNEIDRTAISVFLVVFTVSLGVGIIWFRKRDIAI
jgi:ABC-2 type transport system permease protein